MGRLGPLSISAIVPFVLLGGALVPAQAFAGDIVINLQFNQYFDRISPDNRQTTTHEVITLKLSSNGVVSHSEHHYDMKGREKMVINEDSQLGHSDKVAWKVVNKNSLINIFDYKSFKRAILVTVADNACTAQVDFELKPGFSDYEYNYGPNRLPGVASAVSANDFQCTIGDAASAQAAPDSLTEFSGGFGEIHPGHARGR
jgi:hypothetical protein